MDSIQFNGVRGNTRTCYKTDLSIAGRCRNSVDDADNHDCSQTGKVAIQMAHVGANAVDACLYRCIQ